MTTGLRQWAAVIVAMGLLLIPQTGSAEEWDLNKKPWEKFGASFGVFLSSLDSSFRIGSGIGLDIDVEQLLGLESSTAVFRTDALWRFTNNRRHRLDFTWFNLSRDGDRQIFEAITIEDEDEGLEGDQVPQQE